MGMNGKPEADKEADKEAVIKAILKLSSSQGLSEKDRRQAHKVLGKVSVRSGDRKAARDLQEDLIYFVNKAERTFHSDADLSEAIMNQFGDRLRYFLAVISKETILHHILSLKGEDETLSFDKLQSLIRLLLIIDPALPLELDKNRETPLYIAMESELDYSSKQQIVDCLSREGPGADAVFHSMILIEIGKTDHALHKMVSQGVRVDFIRMKAAWARLEKSSSIKDTGVASALEAKDSRGLTCLHLALTPPFTPAKLKWADDLATFQPSILRTQAKGGHADGLAPLQYFYHARNPSNGSSATLKSTMGDSSGSTGNKFSNPRVFSKQEMIPALASVTTSELDELENRLKRVCLLNFDEVALDNIVYTKDNR